MHIPNKILSIPLLEILYFDGVAVDPLDYARCDGELVFGRNNINHRFGEAILPGTHTMSDSEIAFVQSTAHGIQDEQQTTQTSIRSYLFGSFNQRTEILAIHLLPIIYVILIILISTTDTLDRQSATF